MQAYLAHSENEKRSHQRKVGCTEWCIKDPTVEFRIRLFLRLQETEFKPVPFSSVDEGSSLMVQSRS